MGTILFTEKTNLPTRGTGLHVATVHGFILPLSFSCIDRRDGLVDFVGTGSHLYTMFVYRKCTVSLDVVKCMTE